MLLLSRLVRDSHNMGASWQALQQTQTRQDLQNLHDRMVRRFNETAANDYALYLARQYAEFPSPPFQGSDTIVPLASWDELLQEGNCMQHCVGSYTGMVAAGEVFVYKVTEPERLTLAHRRKAHGWVLDELKGFHNAEPGSKALEAVYIWLHSESGKQQQGCSLKPCQAVAPIAKPELLEEVAAFVSMRGRCSISETQRRFRLGYNAAASLVRCLPDQP